MRIVGTTVTAQPMLLVAATAAMAEIPALMAASLATAGITPAGPPLAVHHDWSADRTAVDVGFPPEADLITEIFASVSAADAAKFPQLT